MSCILCTCPAFLWERGSKTWQLPTNQYASIAFPMAFVSITELQRQKTYLRTCAPREDSDQPAHLGSLIRIFTERILNSQWCNVSLCGQRRLWSDCADAQADLSLRLTHMLEGTCSHTEAQLLVMLFLTPLLPAVITIIRSCNLPLFRDRRETICGCLSTCQTQYSTTWTMPSNSKTCCKKVLSRFPYLTYQRIKHCSTIMSLFNTALK